MANEAPKAPVEGEEKLAEAKAVYDKAVLDKQADPTKYIESLVDLIEALDGIREFYTANSMRIQLVQDFIALEPDRMSPRAAEKVLVNLETLLESKELSQGDLIAYLKQTLSTIENYDSNDFNVNSVGQSILEKIEKHYGSHNVVPILEFWYKARANARGAKHPSVVAIMYKLVSLYEKVGQIKKARHEMEAIAKMPPPDQEASIERQIQLSKFYFDHSLVSEGERAWKDAGKSVNWNLPKKAVEAFMSFMTDLDNQGYHQQVMNITETLLSHPNEEILHALDDRLKARLAQFINSSDLQGAEKFIQKRIKAGKVVAKSDPGSYWQLRLSDILLALGKHKKSNEIFDFVLGAYALANMPTCGIKSERKDLFRRLGIDAKGNKLEEEESHIEFM